MSDINSVLILRFYT